MSKFKTVAGTERDSVYNAYNAQLLPSEYIDNTYMLIFGRNQLVLY